MSRRRRVYKKEEHVDSRYGSPAVARLITTVMKRGKKSLAERIVYTAIEKSPAGLTTRLTLAEWLSVAVAPVTFTV